MRSQPMTVAEGCDLQQRMLEHFNLLPPKMSSSETLKASKVKRLPRKTEQALEASDIFLQLMDDPFTHGIQSADDAINEIRYSMGFSWLAWMFARYFITELIKWLWAEYHREASTPQPAQDLPVGCTQAVHCGNQQCTCTQDCQT